MKASEIRRATKHLCEAPRLTTAEVSQHAAVHAWSRVAGTTHPPIRIEVLKETSRSRVYRLVGVSPGGSSVIAKQRERGFLAADALVYLKIHPRVDVRTLTCYGLDESDDSELCTLFLEDAGDRPYIGSDHAHRVIGGRWLAALHTSAANASLRTCTQELADRGPSYYLIELRAGKQLIEESLPSRRDATPMLSEVLACLDRVERSWPSLERMVAVAPKTLIHGDLKPKNLRVLGAEGNEPWLEVFDWETFGWGPPAVDLAYSSFGHHGFAASPDLDAYAETVACAWPEIDRSTVGQLALAGTVFRAAIAVSWAALSLKQGAGERTLAQLALYSATLDRLLDRAALGQ